VSLEAGPNYWTLLQFPASFHQAWNQPRTRHTSTGDRANRGTPVFAGAPAEKGRSEAGQTIVLPLLVAREFHAFTLVFNGELEKRGGFKVVIGR